MNLRQQHFEEFGEWFIPEFCAEHKKSFIETKTQGLPWTMQPCCKAVHVYHKRTPGLFKEEFSGTGIIALNAKTYHTFNASTSKTSTKGIMCNLNSFNKAHFLDTLTTKKPVFGTNKGIMRKNNSMVTYTQLRSGLSVFYAKQLVCDDGVSTLPINL